MIKTPAVHSKRQDTKHYKKTNYEQKGGRQEKVPASWPFGHQHKGKPQNKEPKYVLDPFPVGFAAHRTEKKCKKIDALCCDPKASNACGFAPPSREFWRISAFGKPLPRKCEAGQRAYRRYDKDNCCYHSLSPATSTHGGNHCDGFMACVSLPKL